MPDSVLTPAPVKTTGRRAQANSAPRRAIGSPLTDAGAGCAGAFVGASAVSPASAVGGRFERRVAPTRPALVFAPRPTSVVDDPRRARAVRCGGRRRPAPPGPPW